MAGQRARERPLADDGDPCARPGRGLGQHGHALLRAEPADIEQAPARPVRGRPRIGQPVRPDADLVRRKPRRDEAVAGEGRQGDEAIDIPPPGPGPAVMVDHPGDRGGADPGPAIAGVPHRPIGRAGDAEFARRAIPHQEGVGADQAVIVQGLHRGAAGVPRRRVDARREQREEIVDVDHVRPEAARRRHHPGDALGRMRRRDRGPQAGEAGIDRLVVEEHRLDRAARPFEGGEVAGHGGILAAADLVAVMGDEDAQRGRAGAHRRPPPVFATRQTWGGRPTRRPLRFLVRPGFLPRNRRPLLRNLPSVAGSGRGSGPHWSIRIVLVVTAPTPFSASRRPASHRLSLAPSRRTDPGPRSSGPVRPCSDATRSDDRPSNRQITLWV